MNKKKAAGIGAILLAIVSIITFGLVKKNKKKEKEKEKEE